MAPVGRSNHTGFFHAVSKNRKRASAFSVIEDANGTPVYKEDQIGQVVVQYFEKLFAAEPGDRESTVRDALTKRVSDEENAKLIASPMP